MLKILFVYITDSFSLLDNPLNDYIVMAAIGAISFAIAYAFVGKLYHYDLIDGRGAGHVLHWISRLIVFVVLFYTAATVIRIYYWFHGLPDYKWWIVGAVVTGVSLIAIMIKQLLVKRNYI